MLRSWRCSLRVTQSHATLLLSSPDGDLLKARLDTHPCHPRALLTLLEGLSLWCGEPLSVALTADASCRGLLPSTLFGDELWPGESALVRFEFVQRAPRPKRLGGLGDFRIERRGVR
jgi:hypothetical protein